MNDQLSDKKRISQLENELTEYRQLVIALEKRIKQLEGRQAESPLIVGELSDQMRAMSRSPSTAGAPMPKERRQPSE